MMINDKEKYKIYKKWNKGRSEKEIRRSKLN
jgi:hypothetical protein